MKKITYEILTGITEETYQLPVFLEQVVDEMGIMVGFDGEIEQVEQFCNFTYEGDGNILTLYNSINTNKLKAIISSVVTVSWGDGTSDSLEMPTVYNVELPHLHHAYAAYGSYDVEVTINSPWRVDKIKRTIEVPFAPNEFPSDFGILTFTVPYSNPPISQTQQYLEDYRLLTGGTNYTEISFLAVGKSRIDEFKKYGTSYEFDNLTITADYTGYTIDDLFYMDFPDGYTYITGDTASYAKEEVYNGMITRDEHLIGFIDPPQIYSDVFIERGKQGVMERNLRLGEIDNVGELGIYGSGFFNVKKE